MDRTRSTHGATQKCLQNFSEKKNLKGKRTLGRSRRRQEDNINIKMDYREVDFLAEDCIDLAQDRVQLCVYVRTVMNLRVL